MHLFGLTVLLYWSAQRFKPSNIAKRYQDMKMDRRNPYNGISEEVITTWTIELTIIEEYEENYVKSFRHISFYKQQNIAQCKCINIAYIDLV